MSVVLSNEEVSPGRRELKIEVPAPAVEAETKRVASKLRQQVRIAGFRPGKAPLDLVIRRYREEVQREVLDVLVPRYWSQAQAETGVDLLLPPQIRSVDQQPGGPLTFVAVVELRPEIELRNLTDWDLPELDTAVTDSEVDEALADLQRSQGEWKPVDRTAARGDLVAARVKPVSDERDVGDETAEAAEPPTDEAAEEGAEAAAERPVRFEVGHPGVWEELSLAVTGLGAGQRAEFTHRENDEAPEVRYGAEVESVEELEVPPLDDELAAKLGDFESLEALKDRIRKDLGERKEQESRARREKALLEQLRNRHPLTVPEGAIEEEVKIILTDYAESLARRGVDLDKAELDWQALAGEARPEAERRVQTRLLLDAVAEAETVEVDESELEETIASFARIEGRSSGEIRRDLGEAGKLGPLRAQLRRRKAVRHLLGELGDAEPTADPRGDQPSQR